VLHLPSRGAHGLLRNVGLSGHCCQPHRQQHQRPAAAAVLRLVTRPAPLQALHPACAVPLRPAAAAQPLAAEGSCFKRTTADGIGRQIWHVHLCSRCQQKLHHCFMSLLSIKCQEKAMGGSLGATWHVSGACASCPYLSTPVGTCSPRFECFRPV